MPLRTLDDCGGGKLSRRPGGVRLRRPTRRSRSSSASFATDPLLPAADTAAVDDAFTDVFADNPGTLYVVAAGNEGNDNDESPGLPVQQRTARPNLICVGMTDSDGQAGLLGQRRRRVGRPVRARRDRSTRPCAADQLHRARRHVGGHAAGRRGRGAAGEPGPADLRSRGAQGRAAERRRLRPRARRAARRRRAPERGAAAASAASRPRRRRSRRRLGVVRHRSRRLPRAGDKCPDAGRPGERLPGYRPRRGPRPRRQLHDARERRPGRRRRATRSATPAIRRRAARTSTATPRPRSTTAARPCPRRPRTAAR